MCPRCNVPVVFGGVDCAELRFAELVDVIFGALLVEDLVGVSEGVDDPGGVPAAEEVE